MQADPESDRDLHLQSEGAPDQMRRFQRPDPTRNTRFRGNNIQFFDFECPAIRAF